MSPLALLLLLALPTPSGDAEPVRVERRIPMMGTVLELTVEAPDRAAALAAGEAAVRALEATERRLSTWRDDSELARLNRAPAGTPVALSPELAAELAAASDCRRRTGGAFDPGIGRLLAAWGVRGEPRVPAPRERQLALAAGGLAGLALLPDGSAVRRRPGLVLDEGGFGKGAGLDHARRALEASAVPVRALLDLGGQLLATGGEPWTVAVAHPRRRDRPVLALELAAGSLATSGASERGAHILDPRSGEPARDFGSLTVLAAGGLEADCLATGLYVLGPEAALARAEGEPGVEALVLEPAGEGLRARATSGLAGRLRLLVDEIRLEIGDQRRPPRRDGRTAAANRDVKEADGRRDGRGEGEVRGR